MLGWIICHKEGVCGRLRPQVRTVCGVPFWTIETGFPRYRREQRFRSMAEILARRGVRRVAVDGVPAELLEKTAVKPVECGPLRCALLPQLLDWVEEDEQLDLSNRAVRLCAEKSDGRTLQVAGQLVRRVRYLVLDTGLGQEYLFAELQRRFGLGQGSSEAVALEICLESAGRNDCRKLHLGEEPRQRLALTSPQLQQGAESLFSAIFQAGKLDISAVRIKTVEFCA